MTVGLIEVNVPVVSLATAMFDGVSMKGESSITSHAHDNIANWLWDDGGCILWDDGTAIAL